MRFICLFDIFEAETGLYKPSPGLDDDELWEELESMEKDLLEKEMQKAEPVEVARQTTEERMFEELALPSAPTTAVKPARQTTDERVAAEFAALEKEMGMAGMPG